MLAPRLLRARGRLAALTLLSAGLVAVPLAAHAEPQPPTISVDYYDGGTADVSIRGGDYSGWVGLYSASNNRTLVDGDLPEGVAFTAVCAEGSWSSLTGSRARSLSGVVDWYYDTDDETVYGQAELDDSLCGVDPEPEPMPDPKPTLSPEPMPDPEWTAVPVDPNPTPESTQAASPASAVDAAPPAAAPSAAAAATHKSLAATGTDVNPWIAGAGAMAVAVGAATLVVARRRRAD